VIADDRDQRRVESAGLAECLQHSADGGVGGGDLREIGVAARALEQRALRLQREVRIEQVDPGEEPPAGVLRGDPLGGLRRDLAA
jgi:hypothetical protein